MTKPWVASGKHCPCPFCGRNVDGKCRRQAELISCWHGDRFHPPAGLRLGDVLTIEGRDWVVVNLSGGFSGNSVMLAPHQPCRRSAPGRRRPISHRQRRTSQVDPFWSTEDTSYRPSNWIVAALYQRHCLANGWEVPL
jgi:hypothetical protein